MHNAFCPYSPWTPTTRLRWTLKSFSHFGDWFSLGPLFLNDFHFGKCCRYSWIQSKVGNGSKQWGYSAVCGKISLIIEIIGSLLGSIMLLLFIMSSIIGWGGSDRHTFDDLDAILVLIFWSDLLGLAWTNDTFLNSFCTLCILFRHLQKIKNTKKKKKTILIWFSLTKI